MSSSLNSSPSSRLGGAELGEQVVAAVAALGRQVLVEELLEHLAGRESLGPRGAGDVGADDRGAGPDGGDERLVDPVLLGPVSSTPTKVSSARSRVRSLNSSYIRGFFTSAHGCQAGADVRHHHRVVAAHRVVGERRLHDPLVVQVLVEVEQHQAAVEERADEVRPGRTVGEDPVAVDQDLLGGVHPVAGVERGAEDVELEHLAVLGAGVVVVTDRVAAHLQQVREADQRARGRS